MKRDVQIYDARELANEIDLHKVVKHPFIDGDGYLHYETTGGEKVDVSPIEAAANLSCSEFEVCYDANEEYVILFYN